MAKLIITTLVCLTLLSACASPYQGQANALTAAYQRGEISANDYQARMTELQSLDLQRRQAISQAWQQGCQNMVNNNLQRQANNAAIYNSYRQPTTSYGTVYTPTGQMYQWQGRSY